MQGEKNALESQVHVLTAARDSVPRQSASKAARKRSKGPSSSTSTPQQVRPLLHCPTRHFVCCVPSGVCLSLSPTDTTSSSSLQTAAHRPLSVNSKSNLWLLMDTTMMVQVELPEAQLSMGSSEASPEVSKTNVVDAKASPSPKEASLETSEAAVSGSALSLDDATASSAGIEGEGNGWIEVKSPRRHHRTTTSTSSSSRKLDRTSTSTGSSSRSMCHSSSTKSAR